LILQGRQGFLGGRTAQKILETLPNSEIAFIEKSGHFPFIEQPEAFFASLELFLQEHFR
jgi:pimeloyl-ACP methyl ester carboxylesterase